MTSRKHTITIDRILNAQSIAMSTQTVRVPLENVKDVKPAQSFHCEDELLDVVFKDPCTILGPSIYVRKQDLVDALERVGKALNRESLSANGEAR